MRPFKIEINLDDEGELSKFLDDYEPMRGRVLANRLGFKGKHSVRAADGLMNFACNRRAAFGCRRRGDVDTALDYERICGLIYKEDIQPFIECW
jgi:hypothetical protein